MKARMRTWCAGALLAAVAVQPALAWGREGHRLTALVAEHYLTPEAHAQVHELLGSESLADVASWADDYRSEHPETGGWHYVDTPSTAAKFDRSRDCPEPPTDPKSPWRDCVTDRILYFEGRVTDPDLTKDQRAIALKFLVHLIGDVHQPFHALGDDKGGNGISVAFLGSQQCGSYRCNLHGVWDVSLIDEQNLSEKKYEARLLQEIDQNGWKARDGGEPTTWATQSHRYAVQEMAPNGALLDHQYVAEASKIVDEQLALGGLRLAHVLNRLLAADDAPEPARTQLKVPSAEENKPRN